MNIKLSLERLQLLDIIDRSGGFAAAAEKLHKAKSAVTYAVKQMEEALGLELFDRSGYKPVLTSAGRLLLRDGRHLLSQAQELEQKVKSLSSGWDTTFRIAVDEAISDRIYPLLKQFYSEGYATHLYVHHEVLGGCWDALLNHRVDLAIGVTGLLPERSDYELLKMPSLHFEFVVAVNHPLAAENNVLTAKQINQFPAIYVIDSARSLPEQSYDVQNPVQVLSVDSIHVKELLIERGVGVGFLPKEMAQKAQHEGRLLIKEIELTRQAAQMATAYHEKSASSKVLQWWLKQLKSLC